MKFSATKTVFMCIAITVCYAFLVGKVSEQAFIGIAMMVFMAYYKGEKPIATPTA